MDPEWIAAGVFIALGALAVFYYLYMLITGWKNDTCVGDHVERSDGKCVPKQGCGVLCVGDSVEISDGDKCIPKPYTCPSDDGSVPKQDCPVPCVGDDVKISDGDKCIPKPYTCPIQGCPVPSTPIGGGEKFGLVWRNFTRALSYSKGETSGDPLRWREYTSKCDGQFDFYRHSSPYLYADDRAVCWHPGDDGKDTRRLVLGGDTERQVAFTFEQIPNSRYILVHTGGSFGKKSYLTADNDGTAVIDAYNLGSELTLVTCGEQEECCRSVRSHMCERWGHTINTNGQCVPYVQPGPGVPITQPEQGPLDKGLYCIVPKTCLDKQNTKVLSVNDDLNSETLQAALKEGLHLYDVDYDTRGGGKITITSTNKMGYWQTKKGLAVHEDFSDDSAPDIGAYFVDTSLIDRDRWHFTVTKKQEGYTIKASYEGNEGYLVGNCENDSISFAREQAYWDFVLLETPQSLATGDYHIVPRGLECKNGLVLSADDISREELDAVLKAELALYTVTALPHGRVTIQSKEKIGQAQFEWWMYLAVHNSWSDAQRSLNKAYFIPTNHLTGAERQRLIVEGNKDTGYTIKTMFEGKTGYLRAENCGTSIIFSDRVQRWDFFKTSTV